MCGRFTLISSAEVVAELFELADIPSLSPRYNIAPTQPVAVVRSAADADADRARSAPPTAVAAHEPCRRLVSLRWGLIPPWAKDAKIGARMINARAETAASKPSFRAAFKRRRCLIPADGFYEWRKTASGKQPYYIRSCDGAPLAFAGLWERWQGPDAAAVETCTILTTEPNELMAPLHDRMPVILPRDAYATWLDPKTDDASRLQPLLGPCPSESLRADPVSKRVNNPANDTPECINPQI